MLDTYFTPVLDDIVDTFDRDTALTWGVIWRLSQKFGHTTARHNYMADLVGLGRRTFTRRLKLLIEKGLIEDLDPDLKGGIHRYRTLRYAIVPMAIEVGQSDPTEPEAPPIDNEAEGLGQSDLGLGQSDPGLGQSDLGGQVTVTEHENTSHDIIHDITHDMPGPAAQDSPPEDPPAEAPRPDQAFFTALCQVCQYDPATITQEQRGAINQASGVLRNKAGAITEDLTDFSAWWHANDWRGKKGDVPRPDLVRSEWGRYQTWRDNRRRFRENQAKAEAQARNARSEAEAVNPELALAQSTWAGALEFLRGSLPKSTYSTYIAGLVVLQPNGSFRLGCDNEGVIEWVKNRLHKAVESALDSAVGRPVKVEYILIK